MAREGLRRAECRVVKKRVKRCGGEEVGWEVSAFRSHWMTDILEGIVRVDKIVSPDRERT